MEKYIWKKNDTIERKLKRLLNFISSLTDKERHDLERECNFCLKFFYIFVGSTLHFILKQPLLERGEFAYSRIVYIILIFIKKQNKIGWLLHDNCRNVKKF